MNTGENANQNVKEKCQVQRVSTTLPEMMTYSIQPGVMVGMIC